MAAGEPDEREEKPQQASSERVEPTRNPVVGTAIGSSDADPGRGGDIGRASAPGDAAGGAHESRATVPGDVDPEDSSSVDALGFARATRKAGSEAGLGAGEGDLGAGGDLAGDFGGLDEEGDEGRPA